jgi:hypothetical protein
MIPRIIFKSVDAMLQPGTLSTLLGIRVSSVTTNLWEVQHLSGNELYEVWLQGVIGESRFILKKFYPERDWVMRLTHDSQTREVALFLHGIFDRIADDVSSPIIAVAENDGTWASLMYDVSLELLPSNQVLDADDARRLIENLARMHACFWDDATLENAALGLSSLQDFLTILSPARVRHELEAGHSHPILESASRGWQQFDEQAPADVRRIIHSLQENNSALRDKLNQLPRTLVHGDYKLGNLGIDRAEQPLTIVLDWQDATRSAGVLDLGYFLALNTRWLPFSKEDAIQTYVESLAGQGCLVSQEDIEIGLVAGGALRLLWLMVRNGQEDLIWWYDLIRRVSI